MMLLQNNEYETAIKNFKNIDHSIPIIYSVIEKIMVEKYLLIMRKIQRTYLYCRMVVLYTMIH